MCSGNTCRSPLAAALLKQYWPDADVGSAGLSAVSGQGAHPHAEAVAREFGLNLTDHRARTLLEAHASEAEVILTMTRAQRDAWVKAQPQCAARTLTLGEAAGEPYADVADPYGSDIGVYRRVFRVLERLSKRAALHLKEPAPLGRVLAVACVRAEEPVSRRVRDLLHEAGIRVEESREVPPRAARSGVDTARWVVEAVKTGWTAGGVVVTDSGIEAAMAAARMGVRTVLAQDSVTARVARGAFDARVLCLGGRIVGEDTAADVVKSFVRTPFAGVPEDLEDLDGGREGPSNKTEPGDAAHRV